MWLFFVVVRLCAALLHNKFIFISRVKVVCYRKFISIFFVWVFFFYFLLFFLIVIDDSAKLSYGCYVCVYSIEKTKNQQTCSLSSCVSHILFVRIWLCYDFFTLFLRNSIQLSLYSANKSNSLSHFISFEIEKDDFKALDLENQWIHTEYRKKYIFIWCIKKDDKTDLKPLFIFHFEFIFNFIGNLEKFCQHFNWHQWVLCLSMVIIFMMWLFFS